jgi:capsid protein
MASALCIPYEFLVLDFKQGSFSASRAALLTTYRTFSSWQSWIIENLMQRLWNWRIAKAIKNGELPSAPVDRRGYSQCYRVQWSTPRYDWIDPQAEAIKNIYNVALGVDSISSVAAAKGEDVEDVMKQKAKDYLYAARNVVETNTQLKAMGIEDRLTLEHFIQVKVPPGIQRADAPPPQVMENQNAPE